MYATTAITDEVDVDRFRRDSNVLRASVFDAAMLLGVGSSRTLQNWIFDGDGDGDADDEDDIVSSSKPAGRMKSIYREDFDAATLASYIFDRDAGGGSLTPRTPPTPSSSGLTPAIRLASGTTRPPRNKLRKPRFAIDESEAEDGGGYATDGRVVARPGNSRRSSRVTVSTNNTASTSAAGRSAASTKKRDRRMSRSYDIVNAVEADAEADEEGYGYLSDGTALAARRTKGNKKSGTMPSSFFRLLVPRPSAPSSQLFISSPQPLGRGSVAIDRPRSRISIGESVQMHARSVTPRSREGVRTRTGSAGESSSGTETPEPRTPSSGVASVRSRTRRA